MGNFKFKRKKYNFPDNGAPVGVFFGRRLLISGRFPVSIGCFLGTWVVGLFSKGCRPIKNFCQGVWGGYSFLGWRRFIPAGLFFGSVCFFTGGREGLTGITQ